MEFEELLTIVGGEAVFETGLFFASDLDPNYIRRFGEPMKDHLVELVAAAPSQRSGRNAAREYLHAKVLASHQRSAAVIKLTFQGSTALRAVPAQTPLTII